MEVRAAFEQLDTSSDGYITVAEIQQRLELDDDGDGKVREEREGGRGRVTCVFCGPQVSLEEAMAYLDNQESVDFPVFLEKVWSFVSDKITFDPLVPPTEATPPPTEAPPPDDPAEKDLEDYDDYGEVCDDYVI